MFFYFFFKILAHFYNESIVRVGCHTNNATKNDLSKTLTLFKEASSEIETDYCRSVMSDYNGKTNDTLNTRFNGWHQFQLRMNGSDDTDHDDTDPEDIEEDEEDNNKWKQVDITKWSQCIIADAEEVGCDECDVHFYHNFLLESDKIFAPIEDDGHAIAVNILTYI